MLLKQYNMYVFIRAVTVLVFQNVESSEYPTNKTIRSCRLPPFSNGTVRSGGQWGTIHTSPASAVACRRVRNFPHSSSSLRTLSPKFPQTPRFLLLNSYRRLQPVPPPTCRYWLVFSSFSLSVCGLNSGRRFYFPWLRFVQDIGCSWSDSTKFPPSFCPRNEPVEEEPKLACLNEQRSRKRRVGLPPEWRKTLCQEQHVSVYLRAESVLLFKKKRRRKETMHLCFVIHVLSHVLTARVGTMSWGCWLRSCMAHSRCCWSTVAKKRKKKK